MVKVLRKRTWRILAGHKAQYGGAIALVMLGSLLFTAMLMVSSNLSRLLEDYTTSAVLEDASFTTVSPLADLDAIAARTGARIEAEHTVDVALPDGPTVRVFGEHREVNRPTVVAGRARAADGELLLSPTFAAARGIAVGDTITLADRGFTVVGLAMLPNYAYPLKAPTDLLYTATDFGLAVVGETDLAGLGQATTAYSVKFGQRAEDSQRQARDFLSVLVEHGVEVTKWTDVQNNGRVSGITSKLESATLTGVFSATAFLLLTAVLLGGVIGRLVKLESRIIGALYALGHRRGELTRNYLRVPMIVGGVGGVLGTVLGAASVQPLMGSYLALFEIPVSGISLDPLIIAASILAPVAVLTLSGWLAMRRILAHEPAALLRGSQLTAGKVGTLERRLRLGRLPFTWKFRVRQQLRSLPRLGLLLAGCSVATLLLLFAFFLKSGMDYFLNTEIANAQNYRYEYVFSQPRTDPVPDGAEPFTATQVVLPGQERGFNVGGYGPGSKISTVTGVDGQPLAIDRVIITKPLADELGLAVGDPITVLRASDYSEHTLVVGAIASSYNRAVLMPLEDHNRTFGYPVGSYTELFSNAELAFAPDVSYQTYSIDDKIDGIAEIMSPLTSMVGVVAFVAFLAALLILYLVTSMLVEESRGTISLLRIFGYRKRQISSLVLSSSGGFVVIGYLLGIALTFASVSALLTALADTLPFAIPVTIEPLYLLIGLVVIVAAYEGSKLLCRRKLDAVSMAEVLNNE